MSKKNIEELYQDKLEGFTPLPDEQVWNRISASLDSRRRKRVVPIWWMSAGAAATLALLIYLGAGINTDRSINHGAPQLTETDSTNPDFQKDADAGKTSFDNQNKTVKDGVEEINVEKSNTVIVQSTVVNPENKSKYTNEYSSADYLRAAKNEAATKVLATNEANNNQSKALANSDSTLERKENNVLTEPFQKNQNTLIQNSKEDVDISNAAIAENDSNDKKSIFEALEEQEEKQLDETGNKWSVGPSIASVYYDAFGEGSPINSAFDQNTKEGSFNFSYGLQVTYQVNKKLSIRSGMHRVDFGYNTNDITFTASLDAANGFANIDYNQNSGNLQISSKVVGSGDAVLQSENAVREEFTAKSPRRDGVMIQEFGYLEVPLELNYRFVDNRIGVSLNGGLSSLFLIDNSISLESQGIITEVGEANNVNTLNFSTNIGLGFDYELLPSMKLMVEPMVKYQLNTFSDTSGDFSPYALGIYSGILYKF